MMYTRDKMAWNEIKKRLLIRYQYDESARKIWRLLELLAKMTR